MSLLSGVIALASDRLIAESFGCINGNFDESDKGGGRVHAPAFASGPVVIWLPWEAWGCLTAA